MAVPESIGEVPNIDLTSHSGGSLMPEGISEQLPDIDAPEHGNISTDLDYDGLIIDAFA